MKSMIGDDEQTGFREAVRRRDARDAAADDDDVGDAVSREARVLHFL